MKSLNTFADHAPKLEWVEQFFERGTEFLSDNSLGPMQITKFKRFLSDADLIEKNKTTPFFELVKNIGVNSEESWSLILIHLVCQNPQMLWYVKELPVGQQRSVGEVVDALAGFSVKEKDARSIFKAFKRLSEIQLGRRLNFGRYDKGVRGMDAITRLKPVMPTERVFLYGLYRFAEACGGYYEFNLSRLLDLAIESEGVSPAEIFAMKRDEVEQILNGLARSQPEYISFTSTHDLELVKLSDDKKSADVLKLFQ